MSIFQQELSILAVMFLIAIAGLAVGGFDFQSARVTEKHERAAAERKADVKPADRLALTSPLGCGQYVQKCDSRGCKVYAVCIDRRTK